MKVRRSLYLAYYLKELDREKFNIFFNYISERANKSKIALLKDVLFSVFRYNISLLEYFLFRFYELSEEERATWAGTGYMYEYQLLMNPRTKRLILDDKTQFYKYYKRYFVHKVADIEDLKQPKIMNNMLSNPSGKMVFKASDGKCGEQVEIRKCAEFTEEDVISYMQQKNYGLVEEFINQHPLLNKLSPSAVNTVRIITQLNKQNEVDILGCRLRISENSPVDNMAAGNLAAVIDEESGIIKGLAVYSDITKEEREYHPVTNVKITGFEIPFWNETLNLAKKAALSHPQNRSIGWDIVITDKGPGLIEGNHDWCKLLWQLPVKKGLKHILDAYKESYKELQSK